MESFNQENKANNHNYETNLRKWQVFYCYYIDNMMRVMIKKAFGILSLSDHEQVN